MARKISTTRSSGSNVLKDGVYQLIVVDANEKTSSSGNEMVELQLALYKNGRAFGRTIYDNLVFSENSQWKFDQFHEALDVEEGLEITCKWYKGKKVFASLVTDNYGGNIKNKVKTYLREEVALDIIEKDITSDGLEEVGDGLVVEEPVRQAASAPARRGRPKQQPAEMDDDEMPF